MEKSKLYYVDGSPFARLCRAVRLEWNLPVEMVDCHHVWNQFTVRIEAGERDDVRSRLSEMKIGTEVYYPIPLHRQECFQFLNCDESLLTETDRAAEQVLSLPIFPELEEEEQRFVVEGLGAVLNQTNAVAG